MPELSRFLLVCAAGAAGSGARFAVGTVLGRGVPGGFPWATLVVNLLGCLLIEVVFVLGLRHALSPAAVATLSAGFLGGFTTYSAFNNQVLALARAGAWGQAAAYVAATVLGCLVAGIAGHLVATSLGPA